MKQLILRGRDKKKVLDSKGVYEVIYISKFLNVVGIEIREEYISKLSKDPNIISYKESEEGTFQPGLLGVF